MANEDYMGFPWTQSASASSDPWHIRNITDANGDLIAEVSSGHHHNQPYSFDQARALANANVLTASGDMLVALLAMKQAFGNTGGTSAEQHAMDLMDAAIAKATGDHLARSIVLRMNQAQRLLGEMVQYYDHDLSESAYDGEGGSPAKRCRAFLEARRIAREDEALPVSPAP